MEEKIVYFEKPGVGNTEETLRLVIERAKARGITKIVIASTRGDTARLAAERLTGTGITMVVIPHQYSSGREQRFPLELKESLEKQGHHVHFATSLFATENLYGSSIPRVMAFLLRTFSQGMKVCVEMILMVVDGGLVASGEQVIAIAGSGRGADTAVVAVAASSRNLPDLHITEIICKPLQTSQHVPNYIPQEG
ncbi:MAG TPA: pyruvate kinase alpha/beta domain-containing protein [Dehalococcoidales bacterium]|nr:pyruvate kinase alpha/beta domain-containing protein [Dehalococcoidales bacterium]